MEDCLKVLVFCAHYLPGYKGGGPIKTIKNLVEQVSGDITFNIITSDRDIGDSRPYDSVFYGKWNQKGKASVFYLKSTIIAYIQIVRLLYSQKDSVIYLNSFFSFKFSFFPLLVAKIQSRKVILAPRGELSRGALSIKIVKKSFFIKLFKFFDLQSTIVFQASSDYEAKDIRTILGENVDVRIAENIGENKVAKDVFQREKGPLRAVFISRITQKKNLLTAIEMLSCVHEPIVYDIYGPIEDQEYWHACEKVIEKLPSHVSVRYKGVLKPQKVLKELKCYDVFYFPTKGENYGHVIVEALCAGLPILIADTTPWRNLKQKKIGWDLSLDDTSAFIEVLDYLASMSAEELFTMRKRVLTWAGNKFSQRDTIEANVALFKYSIGNNESDSI